MSKAFEGVRGKLVFGISGATLMALLQMGSQWLSARNARTEITPQPLAVALEKEFVGRQEFDKYLLQSREDMRRIEDLMRAQQAETAAIRNDIFRELGLLKGTLTALLPK